MKARWMILTVLAAALLALGAWRANAAPGGVPVAAASTLTGSGTIEADSVRITAQTAGRLLTLGVDEGDEVKNGQVVAELDPALPRSEMAKARAALAVAQAQLAQVKAGPRAVDVRRAEAALALAGTVRDGARVTLSDAQAAQDNPQDLSLRVLAAETQAAVAEQKQVQAEASVAAAQAENDFWSHLANLVSKTHTVCVPTPAGEKCQDFNAGSDVINSTFFQWNLTSQKLAGAYDALGIARAAAQAARTSRDVLQAQLANPLAARMQVDAAQSQLLSAEAAVQEADATLALARAGATPEQLRIAELNVQQAQAAVETIQVQVDQLTVRAPLNGLVTSRTAQQGEMALPGVPLLTVANLDEVRLTMYIPETQIALVKPGQKVTVRVDSLPGRAFAGAVTYIATQAEFTPRNAQTAEERAKLVFAIRVTIANADHALKPGMPADAELEVQ